MIKTDFSAHTTKEV